MLCINKVNCEVAESKDVMGELSSLNKKILTIPSLDDIETENMR